jgi:hypothetical protein
MAYVIEIDDTGYYLRDTSTGLRTQYSSRDHLMYGAATVALRHAERVAEGLRRLEQLYTHRTTPKTTEEPAAP